MWKDVVGPDGKKPNVVKPPPKTANQWRNQKLEVIAAALAAPYGVRVISEVDTGRAIPEHQVDVGETVFESIDRMMRIRPCFPTTKKASGSAAWILWYGWQTIIMSPATICWAVRQSATA
jgi:hypothetical protein